LTDRGQTRHIADTTRLTDAAGGTPADRPPLPPVCMVEVRVLDCPVVRGSRSEVTRFEFRLSILVLPDTQHWQANCAVPTSQCPNTVAYPETNLFSFSLYFSSPFASPSLPFPQFILLFLFLLSPSHPVASRFTNLSIKIQLFGGLRAMSAETVL